MCRNISLQLLAELRHHLLHPCVFTLCFAALHPIRQSASITMLCGAAVNLCTAVMHRITSATQAFTSAILVTFGRGLGGPLGAEDRQPQY